MQTLNPPNPRKDGIRDIAKMVLKSMPTTKVIESKGAKGRTAGFGCHKNASNDNGNNTHYTDSNAEHW